MNIFNFFFIFNYFNFNFYCLQKERTFNILIKFHFLTNYYLVNDLIWQEGFLMDFLQKKIVDNWIKKFLIYSSYLFNEKCIYDKIIKFYLNLIIWPMHKLFIFEFNNVASTLFITIFFFFFFIYIFILFYFFLLMF